MGRVRTTLEIEYNGKVRDLKITFDLIDRVRSKIPWEELAVEFEKENPVPNFSMMAKFVFMNLQAAGFNLADDAIDDIYEEIASQDEKDSYILLVGQLVTAYMPKGSKKKKSEPETVETKSKKKKT